MGTPVALTTGSPQWIILVDPGPLSTLGELGLWSIVLTLVILACCMLPRNLRLRIVRPKRNWRIICALVVLCVVCSTVLAGRLWYTVIGCLNQSDYYSWILFDASPGIAALLWWGVIREMWRRDS